MTGLEALDKLAKQIELDEDVDFWEIRNAHLLVEKSLKALEIIKEKNVNMFGFKRDIKQLGNRFTYKYYQSNLGNYHSGFDIQELTEEEFNLLKGILNEEEVLE